MSVSKGFYDVAFPMDTVLVFGPEGAQQYVMYEPPAVDDYIKRRMNQFLNEQIDRAIFAPRMPWCPDCDRNPCECAP